MQSTMRVKEATPEQELAMQNSAIRALIAEARRVRLLLRCCAWGCRRACGGQRLGSAAPCHLGPHH